MECVLHGGLIGNGGFLGCGFAMCVCFAWLWLLVV